MQKLKQLAKQLSRQISRWCGNWFPMGANEPIGSLFLSPNDWRIPSSPHLRERKPTTCRLPRRKPVPNNMRGTGRNHTPAPSLAKPSPAHTCAPQSCCFADGSEINRHDSPLRRHQTKGKRVLATHLTPTPMVFMFPSFIVPVSQVKPQRETDAHTYTS